MRAIAGAVVFALLPFVFSCGATRREPAPPIAASAAANPCQRAAAGARTAGAGFDRDLQPAVFSVCREVFPISDSGSDGEDMTVAAKKAQDELGFLTLDEAAKLLTDTGKPVPGPLRRYLVSLIAQRDMSHSAYNRILASLEVTDACRSAILAQLSTRATGLATNPADVSRVVYELLADPEDFGRECSATVWCEPKPLPNFGGGSADLSASVKLKKPDIERLRRAIDPHSWHPCMGAFFDPTYKIVESPECSSTYLCDASKKCSTPNECKHPQDHSAKIGNWDGKLYENPVFKPGRLVEIENILDVDWEAPGFPNGFTYKIVQSMKHNAFGDFQGEKPCGIKVDDGFVAVSPLANGVFPFSSRKTMTFCGTSNDPGYNAVAHLFLCAMGAAVETSVCCQY